MFVSRSLFQERASSIGPFTTATHPKMFDLKTNAFTATLSALKDGQGYTVNVMAVVADTGAMHAYTATPGVTTLGSAPDSYVALVLSITIPIAMIAIIVILYLVYKNRKMSKELNSVEMQDVPKSAVLKAVRGVGSNPSGAAAGASAAGAAGVGVDNGQIGRASCRERG